MANIQPRLRSNGDLFIDFSLRILLHASGLLINPNPCPQSHCTKFILEKSGACFSNTYATNTGKTIHYHKLQISPRRQTLPGIQEQIRPQGFIKSWLFSKILWGLLSEWCNIRKSSSELKLLQKLLPWKHRFKCISKLLEQPLFVCLYFCFFCFIFTFFEVGFEVKISVLCNPMDCITC